LHLRAASPELGIPLPRRKAPAGEAEDQSVPSLSQPQSLSRDSPGRGVSGRANMRRHVASETLRIPSGRSPAMALLWAQTGISMSDSARAGRSVRRRVDQTAIWRFQVAGSGAGEETQNGCLGCIAQRSDRPALTALSALSLPRGPPRCCRAREGRRPRKYFVQGGNESCKPPSLPEHPCMLSCGDGCRHWHSVQFHHHVQTTAHEKHFI
jgi:hypothetical protein